MMVPVAVWLCLVMMMVIKMKMMIVHVSVCVSACLRVCVSVCVRVAVCGCNTVSVSLCLCTHLLDSIHVLHSNPGACASATATFPAVSNPEPPVSSLIGITDWHH